MSIPCTEAQRLRTLERFQILDTATETAFDNLTDLAAAICETPISLISLVDDARQWFKSRHGLDAQETPRDQAFCAHAINQPDLMVVGDALSDSRFRHNPLVTGKPFIRFYAGAPLQVDHGATLGTLCVIDRRPRTLSGMQKNGLLVLRDAVIAQLELRRAVKNRETLGSALPICAWCQRVRESRAGEEQWCSAHEYLTNQTPVTHGICPDCRKDPGKLN